MKLLGYRYQVIIGLWVLVGLVVAGINGYYLLSLLDEPLAGYSPGARQARRQFQQYQQLMETQTRKIASGMKLLAERFASSPSGAEQKIEGLKQEEPASKSGTEKS